MKYVKKQIYMVGKEIGKGGRFFSDEEAKKAVILENDEFLLRFNQDKLIWEGVSNEIN